MRKELLHAAVGAREAAPGCARSFCSVCRQHGSLLHGVEVQNAGCAVSAACLRPGSFGARRCIWHYLCPQLLSLGTKRHQSIPSRSPLQDPRRTPLNQRTSLTLSAGEEDAWDARQLKARCRGARLQALPAAIAAAAAAAALSWASAPAEESVAVVPGLGLLLCSRERCRGTRSRVVPAERIEAVVINEVPPLDEPPPNISLRLPVTCRLLVWKVAHPSVPRVTASQPRGSLTWMLMFSELF